MDSAIVVIQHEQQETDSAYQAIGVIDTTSEDRRSASRWHRKTMHYRNAIYELERLWESAGLRKDTTNQLLPEDYDRQQENQNRKKSGTTGNVNDTSESRLPTTTRVDSVIVTIDKQQFEKSLNRQRSGYWSTGAGIKWIDRVNMTIDHQQFTDSVMVTIGTNRPTVSFPTMGQGGSNNPPESQEWETIRQEAPCKSTPTRETAAPDSFGWQEWGDSSPRDKLLISDDVHLQPQQHKKQQSATLVPQPIL
jgi:hypothetical protein